MMSFKANDLYIYDVERICVVNMLV